MIFNKDNLYKLSGNDTTDFGIPPESYTNYGCYAPDTLVNCTLQGRNLILYLHRTGVRAWNGSSSELISRKIQTTIDSISTTLIGEACAALVGEEYWISFCTSGTFNNETWALSLITGDWRKLDFGVNHILEWKNGVVMTAVEDGFVYTEKTTTADAGSDISWDYTTKNYEFPHELGSYNRFREFIIWLSLATDTLTIRFTADNDSTNHQVDKTIVAPGSTLVKKRFSLPQYIEGEKLKIKFSSTGQNACEIRAFEIRMISSTRR